MLKYDLKFDAPCNIQSLCDGGQNAKQTDISSALQSTTSNLESILSRVKDLLTDLENSCTNPSKRGVEEMKLSRTSHACDKLNVLMNPRSKSRSISYLQFSTQHTLSEDDTASVFDFWDYHSLVTSKEDFSRMDSSSCHVNDVVDVDSLLPDSKVKLGQF